MCRSRTRPSLPFRWKRCSGREQRLVFRTNVDDVVEAGPEHPIRFAIEEGSGGLKPYVRVRGRLEALVTRAVCYELAELSVPGPDGQGSGLWSGGTWWEMG